MNYQQLVEIRCALYEAALDSISLTKDTKKSQYYMSLVSMISNHIDDEITFNPNFRKEILND